MEGKGESESEYPLYFYPFLELPLLRFAFSLSPHSPPPIRSFSIFIFLSDISSFLSLPLRPSSIHDSAAIAHVMALRDTWILELFRRERERKREKVYGAGIKIRTGGKKRILDLLAS